MSKGVSLLFLCVAVVWSSNLPAAGKHGKMNEVEFLREENVKLLEKIEVLQNEKNVLTSESLMNRNFANESISNLRPSDCSDLLMFGIKESGVYEIYPFTCSCAAPITVYCDMETDGGGWTVLMKRQQQTPQENFNRSWTEYKNGFGRAEKEYWLGNEYMYLLTSIRTYSLRMDVIMSDGITKASIYSTFKIEDETERYKMVLSASAPENSMPSDCFTYYRSRYFSTFDRDYDTTTSGNCPSLVGGGFWYSTNCNSSPTSIYRGTMNTTCYTTPLNHVSFLQMKIRPTICEQSVRNIDLVKSDCNSCGLAG